MGGGPALHDRLGPVRAGALLAALLLALGAPGCSTPSQGPGGRTARARSDPPRYRHDGPRLPATCGRDPRARGWVKVDGLLWIDARDVTAYEAGQVFDGKRHVPFDQALPPGVGADEGFVLRTDHVALSTNLDWRRALMVAREAEAHIARLVQSFGEVLDLRLPVDPLPLVVTSSRSEFEARLRCLVCDPVDWGAFYDADTGVVNVSLEPAARGALPWRADLRHEMTHQILDLSRPPARRGPLLEPPWLWLWEAFAIWTEGLGDGPGDDAGYSRIVRFQKRYAWQDWTTLESLLGLTQACLVGRHYDQTASVMRFLMGGRGPARRLALLDALRQRMASPVGPHVLHGALGESLLVVERRWRATVGR